MFEFPQPFESSTNGLSIEESPKKNLGGGKLDFLRHHANGTEMRKKKRRKKKEKEKEEQFSCSLILSSFS